MTRVLLLGVVWCLVGPGLPAAQAEDAAEARFLRDRDVAALLAAWADRPAEDARVLLARHVLGRPLDVPQGPGSALERSAVPALQALARDDLPRAKRAVALADRHGEGIEVRWLGALLRARVGDDAGALGRLMAPPLWQGRGDAVRLALLAASLAVDDRRTLNLTAERALVRAAARGRRQACRDLVAAVRALDPDSAGAVLAQGLRALRRLGASDVAVDLLASLPGRPPWRAGWALEAAAVQGQAGDRATAQALVRGRRTPRVDLGPLLAAAQGRGLPALPPDVPDQPHREGRAAAHHLTARLATLVGMPTQAADIRVALGDRPWRGAADAAAAGLHALGLDVVVLGGLGVGAVALVEGGWPVLFLARGHEPSEAAEHLWLLRRHDAAHGLFVAECPDVARPEWIPAEATRKGLLIVAAPPDRAVLRNRFCPGGCTQAGTHILAALRAPGALEGMRALEAAPAPLRRRADVALHAAWLGHRHAMDTREADDLQAVGVHLARSRDRTPHTAFECEAWGEVQVVAGRPQDALDAFAHARRRQPPSRWLALARFHALRRLGRRADATQALDRAAAVDPLDAHVRFLRASWFEQAGDLPRAHAEVRRAVQRRPTHVPYAVFEAHLEMKAGRPEDATATLEALLRHAPELKDQPQVRMARRAAELERMRLAPDIDALRQFRRSDSPETRRRLAYTLVDRQSPEAEALLRDLLGDDDARVRTAAVGLYRRRWLRRILEEDAVLQRQILRMARRDAAPRARAAAVEVAAQVEGRTAARTFAALLQGAEADADARVRCAAARALGADGHPDSLAALVAGLADRDVAVRQAVIRTLLRRTGQDHGFDPLASPADRAAAVARWKAWMEADG